jgi:hypothetical protein
VSIVVPSLVGSVLPIYTHVHIIGFVGATFVHNRS